MPRFLAAALTTLIACTAPAGAQSVVPPQQLPAPAGPAAPSSPASAPAVRAYGPISVTRLLEERWVLGRLGPVQPRFTIAQLISITMPYSNFKLLENGTIDITHMDGHTMLAKMPNVVSHKETWKVERNSLVADFEYEDHFAGSGNGVRRRVRDRYTFNLNSALTDGYNIYIIGENEVSETNNGVQDRKPLRWPCFMAVYQRFDLNDGWEVYLGEAMWRGSGLLLIAGLSLAAAPAEVIAVALVLATVGDTALFGDESHPGILAPPSINDRYQHPPIPMDIRPKPQDEVGAAMRAIAREIGRKIASEARRQAKAEARRTLDALTSLKRPPITRETDRPSRKTGPTQQPGPMVPAMPRPIPQGDRRAGRPGAIRLPDIKAPADPTPGKMRLPDVKAPPNPPGR